MNEENNTKIITVKEFSGSNKISEEGEPTASNEVAKMWIKGINRIADNIFGSRYGALYNEKEIEMILNPHASDSNIGLVREFGENTIIFSRNEFTDGDGFSPFNMIYLNYVIQKKGFGKKIALDFMGTMNDPNSKEKIWSDIANSIKKRDYDALLESGISQNLLDDFKEYLQQEKNTMKFRDYALTKEGVKKAIGNYCSIGAEAGQLDSCKISEDVIDFLTLAKISDYKVEVFSTLGPVAGYKSLQEAMLEQAILPDEYSALTSSKTALDLVTRIVVSDKKKKEPGNVVLEETQNRGLHVYVDDEMGVIEKTVASFGSDSNTGVKLPLLCRMERDGLKDSGYKVPQTHSGIDNIVVAKSLMDKGLLESIYNIEK